MRPATAAIPLLLPLLLAGCGAAPDDKLPGVRTLTAVDDAFRCGPLLFPHGCVIVRIERGDSGCAPEVGGYVACNATVEWTATSGAAVPGSRLVTTADGAEGPSCEPSPGAPCSVRGVLAGDHHFDGPGEETRWTFAVTATLESPTQDAATTGEFTLGLEMRVRTDPADEVAS